MKEPNFKVGDSVVLTAEMTIVKIKSENPPVYTCKWWDSTQGKYIELDFGEEVLDSSYGWMDNWLEDGNDKIF